MRYGNAPPGCSAETRSHSLSCLLLQGLNFEEDWKLLTILMGMNDICDYCKDKVSGSVKMCLFDGTWVETPLSLLRLCFQWITSSTT